MAIKSLPKHLSHYTTLTGLQGILQDRQLWASNVSFLNDARELKHGLEASLIAIEYLIGTQTFKQWKKPLHAVAKMLREGQIPNTYAVCLSARRDMLSQWRGYGGGTQGISITFDRGKLSKLFKPQRATLFRVIYTDVSTEARVRQTLKNELANIDLGGQGISALTAQGMKAEAKRVLDRLLPQFKHLGFSDEREYRFVVQHAELRSEVMFRSNRNVLVPYIALPKDRPDFLPISRITIGPGREQGLTKESIELLLRKLEYTGVEVGTSAVPFRA